MAIIAIQVLAFADDPAYCFDHIDVHPAFVYGGSRWESLDNTLKKYANIQDGIFAKYLYSIQPDDQLYSGNITIQELIMRGARYEDEPDCRASSHFHDPLKLWDNSFLSDQGSSALELAIISWWCPDIKKWSRRYSNITWATGQEYQNGPTEPRDRQVMGWDHARSYYFQALTSTSTAARDNNFANTFLAVGHVVHLLHDMAVPAHVRNDFSSHLVVQRGLVSLSSPTTWFANPFEYYVYLNLPQLKLLAPERPNLPTPRVTDFWDTARWRNGNWTPENNFQKPGLAEYANANFFSEETIEGNVPQPTDAHTYAYPKTSTGFVCSDRTPGTRDGKTRYISREPCPPAGQKVKHLAALSWVSSEEAIAQNGFRKFVLDHNVYGTYAADLVPKAMGYGGELVEYFFRGLIDLRFVAGTSVYNRIDVIVQNVSAPGELMPSGEVYLVVRYRESIENLDNTVGYPSNEYQYKVYQYPVATDIPISPKTLRFNLESNPLPMRIRDVTLQLVYEGKLGSEDGAVAVGLTNATELGSSIDIMLPSNGVYSASADNTFRQVNIRAKTNLDGGLMDADGVIELEVEYRLANDDPFVFEPGAATAPVGASAYVVRVPEANGVKALPQGQTVDLQFELSQTPLSVWSTDVSFNLIYRKTSDPVWKWRAVGRKDISEPTPVGVANVSDKICIYGQWYDSGSQAAYEATGRNNLVDINPLTISNYYYTVSTVENPQTVSSTNFVFHDTNLLEPGGYRRVGYILGDYDFKFSIDQSFIHDGTAIRNQFVDDQGNRFPYSMANFRGIPVWMGTQAIFGKPPYPTNSVCDVMTLPPAGQ